MAHKTSQFCPSLPFQACSCDYLPHFSLKEQRETFTCLLSSSSPHVECDPQPGSPFFLFFTQFFFLVIFHSSTSDQISLARSNPISSEALKNIFTVKEENTRRKTNGHNRFSELLSCFIFPGSGRSPGEGNGNPLQYSCLENAMDRGAWFAAVHGVAKSQTQLSDFTLSCSSMCCLVFWVPGIPGSNLLLLTVTNSKVETVSEKYPKGSNDTI